MESTEDSRRRRSYLPISEMFDNVFSGWDCGAEKDLLPYMIIILFLQNNYLFLTYMTNDKACNTIVVINVVNTSREPLRLKYSPHLHLSKMRLFR